MELEEKHTRHPPETTGEDILSCVLEVKLIWDKIMTTLLEAKVAVFVQNSINLGIL
jgi:hypothetical protein